MCGAMLMFHKTHRHTGNQETQVDDQLRPRLSGQMPLSNAPPQGPSGREDERVPDRWVGVLDSTSEKIYIYTRVPGKTETRTCEQKKPCETKPRKTRNESIKPNHKDVFNFEALQSNVMGGAALPVERQQVQVWDTERRSISRSYPRIYRKHQTRHRTYLGSPFGSRNFLSSREELIPCVHFLQPGAFLSTFQDTLLDTDEPLMMQSVILVGPLVRSCWLDLVDDAPLAQNVSRKRPRIQNIFKEWNSLNHKNQEEGEELSLSHTLLWPAGIDISFVAAKVMWPACLSVLVLFGWACLVVVWGARDDVGRGLFSGFKRLSVGPTEQQYDTRINSRTKYFVTALRVQQLMLLLLLLVLLL